MKNIFLNITFFLSILFACNSVDPTPEPDDPLDIQANLLNGTWGLKDASSAVKDNNVISENLNELSEGVLKMENPDEELVPTSTLLKTLGINNNNQKRSNKNYHKHKRKHKRN